MTRETPYAASIGGGEDEYPQEDPDPQTLDIRGSLTSPFETLSERLTFPEEQAQLVEIGALYHSGAVTPVLFSDVRHGLKIPLDADNPSGIVTRWRQKDRLKTTAVALVVCLNIGVDPPDVIKISPCARMECWMDPLSMQAQKALDTIGKNLQAQYERWQPRAKYKIHLDPTSDEVKKLVSSCRRSAKSERVLFHYNGHGVPRPTSNGEIWVFNKSYTQYIPLSIYDLQNWMGTPAIYIFDCSIAGQILQSFKQFFAHDMKDTILMCACSELELLPQDPGYPADVFTCCLTTPIKIALHVFCAKSMLGSEGITKDIIDRIPGKQTDRKTPLGELNWIFTAITDTIAWNALPRSLFQKLFRQDLLVASLFRNFLLAQRIMRRVGCTPVSHPRLPLMDQHPMWLAWDMAAETCLLQLPDILDSDKEYVPSPFFSEQLTAFELWLDHGSADKPPPEQLPIVLQVLLSQVHRLRALVLLGRFIDMGSWAVDLALSVGIFPYILKLLQTSAADLRQTLVFIWAKIVSWDMNPQVQNDLTKDGGYLYFIRHLQDDQSDGETTANVESKAQAAFILSAICRKNEKGLNLCVQAGLIDVIVGLLAREKDEELLKWLLILCEEFDEIDHEGILEPFLDHESPNVRAAAVYSSRGDSWRRKATDGSQLVRHEVVVKALASGTAHAVPSSNGAGEAVHDENLDRLLDDPCLDVRYLAVMCMGGGAGGEGSSRCKLMGPLPKSYQSKKWKKNDSIEYQSPVNYAGEQAMRWPLLGPLAEEEPGAPWLVRQVEERVKESALEVSSLSCRHTYTWELGSPAVVGSTSAAGLEAGEAVLPPPQPGNSERLPLESSACLVLEPWRNEVAVCESSAVRVFGYGGSLIKEYDAGFALHSLFRLNDSHNEVLLCCGAHGVAAYRGYANAEEDITLAASFVPFESRPGNQPVSFAYSDQYLVGSFFAASSTELSLWNLHAERRMRKMVMPTAVRSIDTGKAANVLFTLDINGGVGMLDLRMPAMNTAVLNAVSNGTCIASAMGGCAVAIKGGDLQYFDGRMTSEPLWRVSPGGADSPAAVTCLAGTRLANVVACGTADEFLLLDSRNGERLWQDEVADLAMARFAGGNGIKVATADKNGCLRVYDFA